MKNSFLEHVYFGNIVPADRGFKRNKRLYKISKLSEEAYDKMMAAVPDEYRDCFPRLSQKVLNNHPVQKRRNPAQRIDYSRKSCTEFSE